VSISLHIVNKLFRLLPETRCYGIKARLLGACGFNVHKTARIVSSVRFWGSYELTVGIDTFVGHEVLIAGGNCKITIGDFCDIGPRVSLVAGTHEIDMRGPRAAGMGISRDIIIEDGVWIGANVTILGGVKIGTKAIIAAGSVVTQDIPPYVVAAGVPCKPAKIWDTEYEGWGPVGKEDAHQ
jgi:acetyltransferase-like isoleucine patch superfamily enzyme